MKKNMVFCFTNACGPDGAAVLSKLGFNGTFSVLDHNAPPSDLSGRGILFRPGDRIVLQLSEDAKLIEVYTIRKDDL